MRCLANGGLEVSTGLAHLCSSKRLHRRKGITVEVCGEGSRGGMEQALEVRWCSTSCLHVLEGVGVGTQVGGPGDSKARCYEMRLSINRGVTWGAQGREQVVPVRRLLMQGGSCKCKLVWGRGSLQAL